MGARHLVAQYLCFVQHEQVAAAAVVIGREGDIEEGSRDAAIEVSCRDRPERQFDVPPGHADQPPGGRSDALHGLPNAGCSRDLKLRVVAKGQDEFGQVNFGVVAWPDMDPAGGPALIIAGDLFQAFQRYTLLPTARSPVSRTLAGSSVGRQVI